LYFKKQKLSKIKTKIGTARLLTIFYFDQENFDQEIVWLK